MQEVNPNPSQVAQPTPGLPSKKPSSGFSNVLQNLFLQKAARKQAEAEELLHQKDLADSLITDSLNLGKFRKMVHHIKSGIF